MDRSPSTLLVSWLLVPVAAVLVLSALSLPRQPYTGIVLRGDHVVEVIPSSPGARAGLAAGDRILAKSHRKDAQATNRPLARAVPGRPMELVRKRAAASHPVWLVPEPSPPSERHMMAALLAVASGFVLLGWVWSERRDRLTRAFLLLCLAFALLLAPPPRWSTPGPEMAQAAVMTGVALFLPALFVHFFAMFPGARTRGRRSAWVAFCYWVASLLFAAMLAAQFIPSLAPTDVVFVSAAMWFAAGLLAALALFVASYARAGTADARRRLRVALIGTALGAGPLAALMVIKNVAPEVVVPGDRWAVLLTLLVPASFAWATVVHRVFDFRVALRAVVVTMMVAVAGASAYLFGDWLVAMWWPERGIDMAGGSLAFVALAFSLAGPAAPWLGSFGARVVPAASEPSLVAWIDAEGEAIPAIEAAPSTATDRDEVLIEACEAVQRSLRLNGCMALSIESDDARPVLIPGSNGISQPGPGLRSRLAKLTMHGVHGIEEAGLDDADFEALQIAGVDWLMPVGSDGASALMLLGKRLAGQWLSRAEMNELQRFADHVTVRLENAALRRAASSRGALDRSLRQASVIQAELLPQHIPVYPTLDCAAAALSSEEVGGDCYDFVRGPGRDFTLAVGDAAGKGVPAALLLAQVQARFRSQASRGQTPGELLTDLNRELVDWEHPEKFVGLLCARFEVRSARVSIANGGLPPPLLWRHHGRFEELHGGGLLLGVSDKAAYTDSVVDLGAGDVVVVHTDGLTEARRGEEMFGAERAGEVLRQVHERRAVDILQALLDEVRNFTDEPLDDLTLVVMRQLTNPSRPRRAPSQNALKAEARPADRRT